MNHEFTIRHKLKIAWWVQKHLDSNIKDNELAELVEMIEELAKQMGVSYGERWGIVLRPLANAFDRGRELGEKLYGTGGMKP